MDAASEEYLPQGGAGADLRKESVRPATSEDGVGPGSLPFIPGWLDDLKLPATAFRIYCRICRRGDCYESLPHMAAGCRMRDPTARRALAKLQAANLITKQSRAGLTCVYRPVPRSKKAGDNAATPSKRSITSRPKRGTTHPNQKEQYEGSPSEGSPIKGANPLASLRDWQLRKDVNTVKGQISAQLDRNQPDLAQLRADRAYLEQLEAEKRRRSPPRKLKSAPAQSPKPQPVKRAPEDLPPGDRAVVRKNWAEAAGL